MTAFRSRYLKPSAAAPNGKPGGAAPSGRVARAGSAFAAAVAARFGPLVLLDSAPIRTEARKKYKAARDRFAELQRLAARFHQEDKPQYEQWLQANFGPLVAELRSVRAEVNRLRELIFEVETRTWLNSQSSAAAYRDILERELKRRAEEQAKKAEAGEKEPESEEEPGPDEPGAGEGEDGESRASGGRRGPKLSADKEARLKSAYRALVRRLHPDHNTEVTPLMRERWHAAQQAYQAGDLELLESIETLCLGDEEDESALLKGHDIPVSHILERAARLATSIARQTQKVLHLKKDPGWSFSVIVETEERLERLHRQTAKTLPTQIEHARAEAADLEAKVAQWQNDAERFYPGFKEAHGKKNGRAQNAQAPKPEKAKPKKAPAAKAKPPARAKAKAKAASR
ncbi:MAG TPA: J domain-containing protein [Candidatus Methylacidiphilales bacterium]